MFENDGTLFEKERIFDIRDILHRYLRFWPLFIFSFFVCLGSAFFYLRYADIIYVTTAKVKIMQSAEEQNSALDISKLFSKSSINLENEIAAFNSYRLSEQVAVNLGLTVSYIEIGKIKKSLVYDPPIKVQYLNDIKGLKFPISFTITVTDQGYNISVDSKIFTRLDGHEEQIFNIFQSPFSIGLSKTSNLPLKKNVDYIVNIKPTKDASLGVASTISISLDTKNSDILRLQMASSDKLYAQNVINNLIEVYTKDVILDRQQVSIRTIKFIDERFKYLEYELDSIEKSKKEFKQRNDLNYIEVDIGTSMQNRSVADNELKSIETQLLLTDLLAETLEEQRGMVLLPSDLGLASTVVNQLIDQYNILFFEFEKIDTSAGENNPTRNLMKDELVHLRQNIDLSFKKYVKQLKESRTLALNRQEKALGDFNEFPEKEQLLRSIERQQVLKENLYLLLLQKREEAAISLAITVPNIKVIDYAISENIPIAPQKKIILIGALVLGLLLPLTVLYISFLLNTKINSRNDIEHSNLDIPIVGEIPFASEGITTLTEPLDRSPLIEAFRILGSNITYKFDTYQHITSKILMVTSAMKGDGKTFVALNIALSYAFLNKKVLVIGTDMRNPQLHKYFNIEKEVDGLVEYLKSTDLNWKPFVQKPLDGTDNFHIMFAGHTRLNPALLLTNGKFDALMKEVVQHYDYIVVDTAPTLLVSDTQIISKNADITVFVLRAGQTDKRILDYLASLKKDEKLKNIKLVLNAVGKKSFYGYGYGYNYGYGYGYEESPYRKVPWYKMVLLKMKRKFSSFF